LRRGKSISGQRREQRDHLEQNFIALRGNADNRPVQPSKAFSMPRASIIIPAFNRAALTRQCLDTLLAEAHDSPPEIVVVDDASTDLTARVLARYRDRIRVVTHTVNQGFAKACNDGAAAAEGEHLIFLNYDTVPKAGWLDSLLGYADRHPRAGAVGAKLLYPNDTIQHAGVAIGQDRYPRHIYAGFPADHPAVNCSRQYRAVTGACIMLRRPAFLAADGFDTAFQNGYEDVDLCLRLGKMGYQVHYCHESELYHLESVSEKRWDKTDHNTRLLRERWWHDLVPDDLGYYLEDGLIQIEYGAIYPVHFRVDPILARLDREQYQEDGVSLIHARAGRMFQLLKDNVRLSVRAMEAELRAQAPLTNGAASKPGRNGSSVHQLPRMLCEGQVHWLSNEPAQQLISIILPVKNGARRLRKLLPRLLSQRIRSRLQIVAVDSGSEDESVPLLRDALAKVISIDPASFNHGVTRTLAASHADGDIYVFVGQNTLPADDDWLANLVAPLTGTDRYLAATCSRVLPPPEADLLICKDGRADPSGSPERCLHEITDRERYRSLSHHELRLLINFHTVSAAIRADVFRQIPFREVVTIGEDIQWAKEVLEAGFRIQHEPSSVVYHGHAFTFWQLLERNVDDGIANKQIVGRTIEDQDLVPSIVNWVRDDWRHLKELNQLDAEELEQWQIKSVLRRTAQMVGQWIGVHHEDLPPEAVRRLSAVERVKTGSSGAPIMAEGKVECASC
jgi:GT2 family glycosyltransferase